MDSSFEKVASIEEKVLRRIQQKKRERKGDSTISTPVIDKKENESSICSSILRDIENLTYSKDKESEDNMSFQTYKKLLEKERIRVKELELLLRMRENSQPQRNEKHDSEIAKNLKFIEEVVSEKEQILQENKKLLEEIKALEANHANSILELKNKFEKDLKMNKEAWLAAEKSRKEKWIYDKTNEIKDDTLKGVDSQLQRLIKETKDTIAKKEEEHSKALENLRLSLKAQHEKEIAKIRQGLFSEYEQKLIQEKENNLKLTQSKLEELSESFKLEKEKINKLHAVEQESLQQLRLKDLQENEKIIKALQENHKSQIDSIKEDNEKIIKGIHERKDQEMQNFKETISMEKKNWMDLQEKIQLEIFGKEASKLKAELENEKNEQIEMLISKFEEEKKILLAGEIKKHEAEKNALKKSQEDILLGMNLYVDELKQSRENIQFQHDELALKFKELQAKYEDVQGKLARANEEIYMLRQDNQRLRELEIKYQSEKLNENERFKLAYKEYLTELELKYATEMKNNTLLYEQRLKEVKAELEKNERDNRLTVEHIENQHAAELEAIEEKIKNVIQKKDASIFKLKKDLEMKESSIQKYKELLEKNRNTMYEN